MRRMLRFCAARCAYGARRKRAKVMLVFDAAPARYMLRH